MEDELGSISREEHAPLLISDSAEILATNHRNIQVAFLFRVLGGSFFRLRELSRSPDLPAHKVVQFQQPRLNQLFQLHRRPGLL